MVAALIPAFIAPEAQSTPRSLARPVANFGPDPSWSLDSGVGLAGPVSI
jgi:hypothetical protein